MKTIERIFNAATGETNDIERNMTAQELADHQAAIDRAEAESKALAEAKAKREAALAKLSSLGLDENDLKALGL